MGEDLPLRTLRSYEVERKLQLPLRYLRDITDDFSSDREIGRGGFGVVYKGVDVQSGAVLAVKKLKPILGGQDKQFKSEVKLLARLTHGNIVKLIGYCDETKERAVYDDYQKKTIFAEVQDKLQCYEFLSKGSLDNIIFDKSPSLGLDWKDRYKIIKGICLGLYYLHEGLDNTPIIHMDLKPSNILLDDTMEPKIADFGLSRLFTEEQTRTCTMNLMGSIGYMAPEYLYRGEISTKSDIYSLGILILEIVTRKKNPQAVGDRSGEHFIKDVREHWTDMSQIIAKHPSLGKYDLQQVHRCIEIGLHCVEADKERRPSTGQILNMLYGECTFKADHQGIAVAVAQDVVGIDLRRLIVRIQEAARTALQNKEDCELLARRVNVLAELHSYLQEQDGLPVLHQLVNTLTEAHQLVVSCQAKGRTYRFFHGTSLAGRFRDVERKIDTYLSLFPLISHIGIASRLDRNTTSSSSNSNRVPVTTTPPAPHHSVHDDDDEEHFP